MQHKKTPLISPVPGTQRDLDSFHFGPQGQGKKAYIQASLHADELPGMLVAWKLKHQLQALEELGRLNGEVVLVPVANPIGQNQHLMDVHLGRYESENGQNFNRGYFDTFEPVKASIHNKLSDKSEDNIPLVRQAMIDALNGWQVETELQSLQKNLQLLSCDADLMLDLHCDFEAALHIYSTDYSWQGIEPLARLMGSKANLLANETGGNPFDCSTDMVWQRLNQEFGDVIPQGCLGATVELRGQGDVNDEYADHDSLAIIEYLGVLGIVDNEPSLPKEKAPSSDLAAVETLKTKQGGLLVLKVQPGDIVEAGQVFAEVIDPINDLVEQVKVTQAGYVYSRTNRKMATAGMLIGNIAGEHVIRSGYLLAP
ncbi:MULTISPECIES: succinylglutamate desuccinylase/aspartoacylase family protein [Vibrio]|uniref:Succinylglutamate desuccinylase n=2 Tax=Vibrio TaxID=662 RepID=A0A7X4LKT7_9VIBR|nr:MULTISPECIES: succinylglutamate desuccinylase/aspartoacylase family protein [Vibrio]MBF9001055.1 succinylglutamate desuccinylase/aspartoacylase family protein [Vibrio nitrifigilis]MZI93825.1 succinylglutamate desuccinylase [Vibrio eleionomae]